MKVIIFGIFQVFVFSILNGQSLTDSLVGHWQFNGNLHDASSFSNNASSQNNATFNLDRFGRPDSALRLNKNQSQYLSVANHVSLQIGKSISISFWAKRNSLGGQDQVLNKGGDVFDGSCNYGLVFSDNTLVFIYHNGYQGILVPGIPSNLIIDNDDVPGVTYPGAPQDTLWHHYAISAEHDSMTARFYVDGISVPTFYDGTRQINLKTTFSAPLYIGGINYYSNNSMDEIRIYRRVLSKTEIQTLANACDYTYRKNIQARACFSYTAPDGKRYNTSGMKTAMLKSQSGCDSIVSIDLVIDTVDVRVDYTQSPWQAMAGDATFRWLDCNNGFDFIPGENKSTFSPPSTGSFAVEVTQNGCLDTSLCIASIPGNTRIMSGSATGLLYPNPTSGFAVIQWQEYRSASNLILSGADGRILKNLKITAGRQTTIDLTGINPGTYFIIDSYNGRTMVYKVLKTD